MRAELIKLAVNILALLPLKFNYKLAYILGKWLAKHPNWQITKVTHINLALCFPQLSAPERQQLAEQSLIEACNRVAEFGALLRWRHERSLALVLQVHNEDCVKQALAANKGLIMLTPHFAAWELAGLYVATNYPLTALYKPAKLTGLDAYILAARQRSGGRYVAINKTGIKTLYQALKNQQVIGILPDQVPAEGNGVAVEFFGQPASTMTLVSRLAQKTLAPVIFCYALRVTNGFHIHFFVAETDIYHPELQLSLKALNRGVENCIMQQPAQYQWNYKRFKYLFDYG